MHWIPINAIGDALLTDNKDSLESGVKHPAIMTPAKILFY